MSEPAANVAAKIDALALTGIDDAFSGALAWSNTTGEYPLDSEEYLAARFGPYQELQSEATAHVTAGDQANDPLGA